MVKKVNQDGIKIKVLCQALFPPSRIARMLGICKQKVNYWLRTEIKMEVKRKTKLDEEEIYRLVKYAQKKNNFKYG